MIDVKNVHVSQAFKKYWFASWMWPLCVSHFFCQNNERMRDEWIPNLKLSYFFFKKKSGICFFFVSSGDKATHTCIGTTLFITKSDRMPYDFPKEFPFSSESLLLKVIVKIFQCIQCKNTAKKIRCRTDNKNLLLFISKHIYKNQ